MVPSINGYNIWWLPPGTLLHGKTIEDGGWFFKDECEQLDGPWHTEAACIEALKKLAESLR